jgi:hypothetical protein
MRLVAVRERQRRSAVVGDQALEAFLARKLEEDGREHRVILDDQDHVVAMADGVAVVGRGGERHRNRGLPT